MTDLGNIKFKDLLKNPEFSKDLKNTLNTFNNDLTIIENKTQNIFSNLGISFSSFNNVFSLLNNNLREVHSNLQNINRTSENTFKSSAKSSENFETASSDNSAAGVQQDFNSDDPKLLTNKQKRDIEKKIKKLKDDSNKAYLNTLIDVGIIGASIASDGALSLPLVLGKNMLNAEKTDPEEEITKNDSFDGTLRPTTDSYGPTWLNKKNNEDTKKIASKLSRKQIINLINQSKGIYNPIYDDYLENKDSGNPIEEVIKDAIPRGLSKIGLKAMAETVEGGLWSLDVGKDMKAVYDIDNKIAYWEKQLKINEKIEEENESKKTKEQQIQDSLNKAKEQEKYRPQAPSDWRERQSIQEQPIDPDKLGHSEGRRTNTDYDLRPYNRGRNAEHTISDRAGGDKKKKGPDPLEVFTKSFGEAQKIGGALSGIMNTLHIGTDTFVGKMIEGFNSTLSIISDVLAIFQAIKNIQAIGSALKSIPFLSWLPFAEGGHVPGFGDTDSVPAMLTPGEFIVRKSVVNKFGSGFFEWMNGGGLTNSLAGHYAGGGMVSQGRSMQLEIVGSARITGRGSDLRAVITKENFRLRNARSAG